jgi:hypothetical protein
MIQGKDNKLFANVEKFDGGDLNLITNSCFDNNYNTIHGSSADRSDCYHIISTRVKNLSHLVRNIKFDGGHTRQGRSVRVGYSSAGWVLPY